MLGFFQSEAHLVQVYELTTWKFNDTIPRDLQMSMDVISHVNTGRVEKEIVSPITIVSKYKVVFFSCFYFKHQSVYNLLWIIETVSGISCLYMQVIFLLIGHKIIRTQCNITTLTWISISQKCNDRHTINSSSCNCDDSDKIIILQVYI